MAYSCLSLHDSFLQAISDNKSFLSMLVALLAGALIVLYVLVRMNPSNRKLALLFQDVFRNTIISALMVLFTPGILLIFCLTFSHLIPGLNPNTDFSQIINIGRQFVTFLQNSIIMTIRQYRELAITRYGPNSIVYEQISVLGKGTAIIPTPDSPINSIFLDNANYAIGALNAILISISIQKFLIDFFTSTDLFYILMLLSLMIRIIPGLREVGDFMYAFSISLFMIFPFLYTMFIFPFYDNPSNFDFCGDIMNRLNEIYGNFSFRFFTPISCSDLSFIEVYTIYAIFLPNLVFGLTFSFASNFKKIFDIFQVGG